MLPVHHKGIDAKGPRGPVLPTHVFPGRSHKIDPVSLARADKLFGAHRAGIDQVHAWGESLGGEGVVDDASPLSLVDTGRGGVGVDDQARRILIAGLREVDHVTHPAHPALGAEAGLDVIGRLDPLFLAALADRPKLHA